MNQARKRKLYFLLLGLAVLFLASFLLLYALRQNISLFYSPSDLLAGKAPNNRLIRVGGMVEQGSLRRSAEGLGLCFQVTDLNKNILIEYSGVLPDLFREGQGIVAAGTWTVDGRFIAQEVLAKHDEKYMPPEVKAALVQKD